MENTVSTQPQENATIASDESVQPSNVAASASTPAAAGGDDSTTSFYAVRTTGGQEKMVMNLLEAKAKMNKIDVESILLVDNLRGYVVMEATDPNPVFQALDGIRHVKGQLRGELAFDDIEGYLVKKSSVTQLGVDNIVEITGGPFKGMKATITRIDHEKEDATVVLLDASYQLPVTVDANYLKLSSDPADNK